MQSSITDSRGMVALSFRWLCGLLQAYIRNGWLMNFLGGARNAFGCICRILCQVFEWEFREGCYQERSCCAQLAPPIPSTIP
jgi:hypothetical protein